MRESRPYGSERGAFSNGRPYRDRTPALCRRAGTGRGAGALLFASPQGLWDLPCRSGFRRWSNHSIAVEQLQSTAGRKRRGLAWRDLWGFTVLEVTVRLSGRAFRRGERLADALDVAGSNGAGKQAVVADAVEAAGQDVQEKAADELGRVERHGPEPVAAFDPVVLPPSGDCHVEQVT